MLYFDLIDDALFIKILDIRCNEISQSIEKLDNMLNRIENQTDDLYISRKVEDGKFYIKQYTINSDKYLFNVIHKGLIKFIYKPLYDSKYIESIIYDHPTLFILFDFLRYLVRNENNINETAMYFLGYIILTKKDLINRNIQNKNIIYIEAFLRLLY